ncbi:MAG: hypothetical protein ACFCVH_16300 [Alphaproteobacteria bacterium]
MKTEDVGLASGGITRRAALWGIGTLGQGFVGGVGGVAAAMAWNIITKKEDVVELSDSELIRNVEVVDAQTTLLGDLFDFFGASVHIKPGLGHWDYEGNKPHPDNMSVAQSYFNVLSSDEKIVAKLVEGPDQPSDFEGSVILLGDPVSNILSRQMLGFDLAPNEDPINPRQFVHVNDGPFTYPFRLVLCEEDLRQLDNPAAAQRISENRINTSIKNTKDSGQLFIPGINADHYVHDFLLITVIPNLWDRDSYFQGKKVVMFSGTHGPGTLAAGLLMQDSKSLLSIWNQVKGLESWQAVVKCGDLTSWDNETRQRQRPRALIGEPVCLPVEIDRLAAEAHVYSLPVELD